MAKKKRPKSRTDVPGDLWSVEIKLCSIAHFFEAANADIQPDQMDLYGMGLLIREISNEVGSIREAIESEKN